MHEQIYISTHTYILSWVPVFVGSEVLLHATLVMHFLEGHLFLLADLLVVEEVEDLAVLLLLHCSQRFVDVPGAFFSFSPTSSKGCSCHNPLLMGSICTCCTGIRKRWFLLGSCPLLPKPDKLFGAPW